MFTLTPNDVLIFASDQRNPFRGTKVGDGPAEVVLLDARQRADIRHRHVQVTINARRFHSINHALIATHAASV